MEKQTRLAQLLKGPGEIDLAEGSLLVAVLEYPHLNVNQYLKKLDAMAQAIRIQISPSMTLKEKIGLMNHFMFKKWGFRGNQKDYYNPKNSFLNDVIDYKTGIPITLSIVYLSLAHELGFPLEALPLRVIFVIP